MNQVDYNKLYNENKKNVYSILNCICNDCGAKLHENYCTNCGKEATLRKEFIEELKPCLNEIKDLNEVSVNELYNLLYALKDENIKEVNDILEKNNYYEKYEMFSSHAIENFYDKNNIEQSEKVVIENILENPKLHENPLTIYNLVIRRAVLKKDNVCYNSFKNCIRNFTKESIKNFFPDAICGIGKYEKTQNGHKCGGCSYDNVIFLDENEVKKFYENGYISLLMTISHEITHTSQQSYLLNNENLDDYSLNLAKEYFICQNNPEYYNENYDVVSFETDAYYRQADVFIEYLNSIVTLSDRQISDIKEEQEKYKKLLNNKSRTIDGKPTTIDGEFKKTLEKHPECLQKFPGLYNSINNVDEVTHISSR